MAKRSGHCLCGVVKITADTEDTFGACHCTMCRRWNSGTFMAVKAADPTIEGEDNLGIYTSSDWAERAFCKTCGTNMFYRVTIPGPHQGAMHLAVGTLESLDGMKLNSQIFIDRKPDAFSFEGEMHTMTEAEVLALFSSGGSPE